MRSLCTGSIILPARIKNNRIDESFESEKDNTSSRIIFKTNERPISIKVRQREENVDNENESIHRINVSKKKSLFSKTKLVLNNFELNFKKVSFNGGIKSDVRS